MATAVNLSEPLSTCFYNTLLLDRLLCNPILYFVLPKPWSGCLRKHKTYYSMGKNRLVSCIDPMQTHKQLHLPSIFHSQRMILCNYCLQLQTVVTKYHSLRMEDGREMQLFMSLHGVNARYKSIFAHGIICFMLAQTARPRLWKHEIKDGITK